MGHEVFLRLDPGQAFGGPRRRDGDARILECAEAVVPETEG